MKCTLISSLLFSLMFAGFSWAEDVEPEASIPAPSNVRSADYPRIHTDLRVTFRIKAPDAYKFEFDLINRYPAIREAGS